MIQIRRIKLSDYSQFHTLINFFRPTNFSETDFCNILIKMTASESGSIWVAETDNNQLIGTATMIIEQKFIYNCAKLVHIEDVCVHPDYRGRGLGKQLVQHLISVAAEQDAYKVTLNCSDENIGFYTACGMERRGNQMTKLLKNL